MTCQLWKAFFFFFYFNSESWWMGISKQVCYVQGNGCFQPKKAFYVCFFLVTFWIRLVILFFFFLCMLFLKVLWHAVFAFHFFSWLLIGNLCFWFFFAVLDSWKMSVVSLNFWRLCAYICFFFLFFFSQYFVFFFAEWNENVNLFVKH